MYTNRALLLRGNSLLPLYKICCSSRNSSDAIKLLDNLTRRLSAATDRFDFQNRNEHQSNTSSDYSNSVDEFNSDGQNPKGFRQNPNGQNLNPSEGLRGSPRNDYVRNPVGEIRGFSGQNDGILQQNQNGVYQNYAGFSRDNIVNENQRNDKRESGNFNGYNVQNGGNLHWNQTRGSNEGTQGSWQNRNGVYGESARGFQMNSNGFNQNQSGNYWGSAKNDDKETLIQQNVSVSGAYYGLSRQNTGSVNTQKSWDVKDYSATQNQTQGSYQVGNGQTLQNQSSFNSQVQYRHQGNINWNQTRNTAHSQQSQHSINTEMYPQNWQNPHAGQNQASFTYQNGMPNHGERVDLAQASDNNDSESKHTVTVEELDAFCKEGKLKEALEVLRLLMNKGSVVDLPRLLQLVQLCGEAEALQEAKSVHEQIIASVSYIEIGTYNKIIEMYSRCGSIDDALSVFDKMPEKNLETWDTMIRWLAKNGLGEEAIDLFTRFKEEGNKPDSQIFIGVFSVCAVVGDVNEGLLHFESMCKEYGIIPSLEHYVGVVDMLATTGYLDEALDFVERMPIEPSVEVWETLMNLSRVHGNLELGDRCAEIVEQLDASRLNEQSKAGLIPIKASDIAKEKLKKMSGSQNPLEIRSRVHEYRAGDTSHPENDKIYTLLKGLKAHMVEMGYIPETRFVLHDVDQESKEEALLSHSERLAFAHGLLTTPARSSIRVIKNLRVCVDCHNALKIISKIVGREFIMRDAKRFHHLKDGVCSCRDYW